MKRSISISIILGLSLVTAIQAGWTIVLDKSADVWLAECRCPDSGTGPGRPAIDPLIPYIISPRRTFLLTDKPTLRWNRVPRATSYTVSIETKEGEEIWKQENVTGTQVIYSGNPPLQVGVNYSLIVVANTGKSSQEEDGIVPTFRLLTSDDSRYVREAIALLNQQPLNNEEKSLLQAHLYIGYYLRAEAVETLEKLVEAGSQKPDVYRLLGNIYSQMEVILVAQQKYMKAIELYEALGDTERVRELRQRLEELNLRPKV